ncbi:glycosyltransferase family 2 protein [uncultured Enorma sp.]|uniref:glycosyltransferase family 2 protein n=1 Tax=uncultured Enorma sp. TaxID=1714346 RepID=UPI0026DCB56D|nr:glycosyltransferase family 2 protein [uncultured Enorma sp.]
MAIIPAYNEESSLQQTVEELSIVAPDVDFVVVNDGSTDDTRGICIRYGYPVLDMPVNCGLTVGFQTGMKYALRHDYDYTVQFDADGQHRPEYIKCMLDCMKKNNADIVIGSRFVTEKKEHSARMMGSRLITSLIKVTTGCTINDPTSGMRLYNHAMIERFARDNALNPEPESIAYLVRQGAEVCEVQVSMRERQAGESYLNITKSIAYMVRAFTSIMFVQWFRR